MESNRLFPEQNDFGDQTEERRLVSMRWFNAVRIHTLANQEKISVVETW
jgi:hypothetical protein